MTTNAINVYDEGQGELIPYAESDEWRRAYAVWLAGKRPHTRRAYERIVFDFLQFANVPPAAVTGDMVNAWKLHLQSLGRADTTIAQRLAAGAGPSRARRWRALRNPAASGRQGLCSHRDL